MPRLAPENQVKGMAAFCTLSQILPIFNEGWEPNWDEETIKYRIRTYEDGAIRRPSQVISTGAQS
jgi:hypothetical protein